jgi:hypothetical protein
MQVDKLRESTDHDQLCDMISFISDERKQRAFQEKYYQQQRETEK